VTLLERGDRLRGSGAAQILARNGVAALHSLGLELGDLAFPSASGGIRRPDGRVLVDAAPPRSAEERQEQPARPTVAQPADYPAAADGAGASTRLLPTVADLPASAPAVPERSGREAGPEQQVLHAGDLHDLLMAGLGNQVDIRMGVHVTTVAEPGSDLPSVGTGRQTFRADLVVAADGADSVIRRRLAPSAQVASAGYTAWRALVPWHRAPQLSEAVPPVGELLGAGMRFGYATLGERWRAGEQTRGGVYWYATAPGAPRPEPGAVQLGLLRRWFTGWRTPVAELLEATQADDLVPQPALHLSAVPDRFGFRIGGGAVVLVGDAAHVITPSLTQGACLALEDAAVLGMLMRNAVPGQGIATAVEEFTRLRRDRVARLDRLARRLDRVVQAQGRLTVAARDALLSRFASRVLDPAIAVARDWTVPAL
jgi:2-polyprenyl-6-methoxyphenol hydroxylase-like FAD-dependent oxidoreductase